MGKRLLKLINNLSVSYGFTEAAGKDSESKFFRSESEVVSKAGVASCDEDGAFFRQDVNWEERAHESAKNDDCDECYSQSEVIHR